MINLLLGAPGGGKSYEAVVYHILEAVKKGRKVITNLPLSIPMFEALDPAFGRLIELRTRPLPIRGVWDASREAGAYDVRDDEPPVEPTKGARVFGGVWDYYDTWKHPETGQGPLFVIDECHLALPMTGTNAHVEEWFSLHRHFNADGLLITQSYGKINRAVRDLVQLVYRVRKNIALGSTGSYTRKVQDGLRGEVVNTAVRTYRSEYFKLYRSHTQGNSAAEFNASDVRPFWKHWSVLGAGAFFVLFACILATGKVRLPWTVKPPDSTVAQRPSGALKPPTPQATANSAVAGARGPSAQASSPQKDVEQREADPFAGRGLHLSGYMEMGGRRIWSFALSQNGQLLAMITDAELSQAGYTWKGESQCSGVATFHGATRRVICDAPSVGVSIPAPQGV